ncbi:uncharacterized protein LOC121258706 [Juglans microcarpa x Juglans regia]|uniref:uncharacterized protein LOC121258706 n=1 Tax=Juglans microcarpa x Juglans regia TaxID=2249226 RepID=UPI001B7E644E|nr:uncharacterized protein LOC121258706 [Juglans microcarpa x Juglans regia]
MAADQKGQSSYSMKKGEVWKDIWKLLVPNATCMLLWRACHESLQTNQNLVKRRIRENAMCPICQIERESVTHALWSCSSAQDVWGASLKSLQKIKVEEIQFKVLVANQKQEAEGLTTYQVSQWTALPPQVFKANWDASVDRANCRIGVRVIIRDWHGQLHLSRIILEGDAKIVVDEINSDSGKWTSEGMIIQYIRNKLGLMQQWSVKHVPRNLNIVAHLLAKDALKLFEESIVTEGIPPCIQAVLI